LEKLTGAIVILREATAVFSADCKPTCVCCVTLGRVNVEPGIAPSPLAPPSDAMSGRF